MCVLVGSPVCCAPGHSSRLRFYVIHYFGAYVIDAIFKYFHLGSALFAREPKSLSKLSSSL